MRGVAGSHSVWPATTLKCPTAVLFCPGLLEDHPDFTTDWVLRSEDVDYDPTKAIGAGGFAQVFRGKYRGQDVAVKVIHQNLLDNEER